METQKITELSVARVAVDSEERKEVTRKSLTYGQDVWKRFRANKLAITGSFVIILVVFFALFGNIFTEHEHSDQSIEFANITPVMDCWKINDDKYIYVHPEYTIFEVSGDGMLLAKLQPEVDDVVKKERVYIVDDKEVVLNYSNAAKIAKARKEDDMELANSLEKYTLTIDGESLEEKTIWNKSYILGTDYLGRDMYARLIYGARISLLVALVATIVQFCVGVIYGGIAGYIGGKVDNIMMRIVDIINTVPLTLYVVLLMVVMGPGIMTIIVALGSVYWVGMARQVRGEVLNIKQQEFIMAAKTLGASTPRILVKHLIPNAMNTIIVTLAMNIPSAIFTESFLSFIGLGISAPAASWGTLASDAIGGLRSYPYQLLLPSICICVTVLGFNFLGDGLRDALDPKLRK